MEQEIYLIYWANWYDDSIIKGYIVGTEQDARDYCKKLDATEKHGFYTFEKIENLSEQKDDIK